MRKFYSLFIALLTVCGLAKAQVVFDFTGDTAYEQFGLAGFSSTDSHDGDITENASVTSGDVTITVSPVEKGNANRMWTGSLRLYGGTLTVASSGKNITAINFTLNSNKWGSNSANVGTLETGNWTGDAASVVITIGGNTQIKSISVTTGGDEPGPGPQPGEIDWTSSATSPLTVAQVQEKAAQLEQGASSDKEVYVKGKISEIKSLDVSQWKRAQYFISDDGTTDAQFLVYNGYYLNGADFTDNEQIKVGDDVIVVGFITNYNGTLEFAADNKLYSHNGNTDGGDEPGPGPQPGEIDWTSSAEAPLTVAQVLEKAEGLETGKSSDKDVFVKGFIKDVKSLDVSRWQRAQYTISDDAAGSNELLVYNGYYLKGVAFTSNDQIQPGDEVIVVGKITNYKGTIEVAQDNKLYSHNGNTGEDTPEPTAKEYTKIADIKADVTEKREDVVFKANNLLVTFVNGKNVYVYDGKDGLLLFANDASLNEGIKAGDKVTADVKGQLYLYNGLTEIAVSAYENLTVNSSDNAVEPQKVTIADVTNNARDYENELIQIEGLYAQAEALANRNINFMDDSDNEIVVRDNWNVLTGTTFDTESEYSVTAFVALYNGNVQLYPRTAEDVTNGETPQPYEFTGDGSLENPYTVEDIQHKEATSTKEALETGVWVKAYIVGYINGSSLSESTAIFSADAPEGTDKDGNLFTVTVSNILVADAAGASTVAAVIPVGTVNKSVARENLNLADNPGMLGQQVWLKGDILKYMGVSGLKNVSEYSLNGSDIVTAISTVEAAAAQGAIYTIAGQRIQHINRAGLYIVGGKKVAVK